MKGNKPSKYVVTLQIKLPRDIYDRFVDMKGDSTWTDYIADTVQEDIRKEEIDIDEKRSIR